MSKVSVIVPVYNMEKYLTRCFNSLINQTFSDIEILAISDGSTDKSVDIIKRYASKDKRIKLFEKENAGYGSVFEFAIKRVKSKYFLICDPDDYLEKNAVEILYNTAVENNVDLVYGSYYYVDKHGDRRYTTGVWRPTVFTPVSDVVFTGEDKNKFFMMVTSPHAKLYKTSLAKNIDLPHNVNFTDRVLYMMCLAKAKSIIHVKKPLANYFYQREGNTMTDTRPIIIDYRVITFNSAWDQYEDKIKEKSNIFYYCMFLCAHYILNEMKKLNDKKTFLEKRKQVYSLFLLCNTRSSKIKKAMKLYPLKWGKKRDIVNALLLNRLTIKLMFGYLSKRVYKQSHKK